MKSILYMLITFLVCRLIGLSDMWVGFSVITVMFFSKGNKSFLWEIPLGVLAGSIIAELPVDDFRSILYVLIPVTTTITAFFMPEGFVAAFTASIAALLFKNAYTFAAVWAFLWYSVRSIFVKTPYRGYFTTKRKALQGNNFQQE